MLGLHHSQALGHRRRLYFVDVENLEGGTRAHDVDDGIEATHLMEMDLGHRCLMQVRLGFGQGGEHGLSSLANTFRETGLLDETGDVRIRTHHGTVVVGMHHQVGGAEARALRGFRADLPSPYRQAADDGLHFIEVGAGVDERPESHVTGDAGEAVEPGHTGHERNPLPTLSSRATPQAAPYPLSMPTTVTPAAHELSMASSAVTPANEDPYPTLVGTAITGPEVRPPMTDANAPSMPATATTTSAVVNASRWANSRCRPATPQSTMRRAS